MNFPTEILMVKSELKKKRKILVTLKTGSVACRVFLERTESVTNLIWVSK